MTKSTTAARNLLISLGLVICLSYTAEAGLLDLLSGLSATTTTTTTKQSVTATYLGCYADDNTRDLSKDLVDWSTNTIETCVLYCWKKNYKYMGLQYGSQCFCGNSYGLYGKRADKECNMTCSGNSRQVCGQAWRNSIYSVSGSIAGSYPYNGKYLGCYTDQAARDLNGALANLGSKNTIENCISYCYNNYMQYAGLQYSTQCFCSNSTIGKYGKVADSNCNMKCTGNSAQMCGGSYLNSVYQLDVRPNPCNAKPSPCSAQSTCTPHEDGSAVCTCPAGKTNDGNGNCCTAMSCGCWGDPHCHSFDNALFEFQGRCKYDLISTDCYNTVIPSTLEKFNVRQKQENRDGVPNAANVAFVQYMEVNAYGNQYRLLKKSGSKIPFSINGILVNTPYADANVTAASSGSKLTFTTRFGLTISWDGDNRADVYLCSSYAKYICGLCGNADGNATNDYVDRKNVQVPLNGTRYTQYFTWGSNYRVYDDSVNAVDINNSTCNPVNPPGTVDGPTCTQTLNYQKNSWCGAITNTTGIWSTCVKAMNANRLNELFNGCFFDVCIFENNSSQKDYLCRAYSKFNDECLALGATLNKTWAFNWRNLTGCLPKCGDNQVYEARSGCPKTCLYPSGSYNCGSQLPIEDCYCADGYVVDSNGNCVTVDQCGCTTPDGKSVINPGQSTFVDCTTEYYCNATTQIISLIKHDPCSAYGYCQSGSSGTPQCYCNSGYTGDGYNCALSTTKKITSATTTTTTPTTTTTSTTTTTKPTTTTTTQAPTTTTTTTTTTAKPTTTTSTTTTTPTTTTTTTPTTTTTTTTTTPTTTTTTTTPTTTTTTSTTTTSTTTTTPAPTTTTSKPTTTPTTPSTTTTNLLQMTGLATAAPSGKCSDTAEKCYIYGDPHYITMDGSKYSISDDCAYLIASDACAPAKGNIYQVFAVHEHRNNLTGVSYLGKIVIKYENNIYELKTTFSVNGVVSSVPYTSSNGDVVVTQDRHFTIFQTDYFIIHYDGNQFFHFSRCKTSTICGLCGVQLTGQSAVGHTSNINDFLVNDSSKSYCASTNTFSTN